MARQRHQRLRRALAHAFASGALILVGWFVVDGLQAPFSDDEGAGVILIGLFLVPVVVVVTRLISGLPESAARGGLGCVAGIAVGVVAIMVGNSVGGWTENVGLYATILAFAAVLVPPRSLWWVIPAAGGAGVAAAFGDVPLPGVAIGLLVAALGPLVDLAGGRSSERPGPGRDGPVRGKARLRASVRPVPRR